MLFDRWMIELEFDKALELAEQKIERAKEASNNRLWAEALVRAAQTFYKKESAAQARQWLASQELPTAKEESFYVKLYLVRLGAEEKINSVLAQELWDTRNQWGAISAEQISFYQEGNYPPGLQKSLLEAFYTLWTDELFEDLKPSLKDGSVSLVDLLASPSIVAEQESLSRKLARIHHEAVFSLHQMGLTDGAIELERLWIKKLSQYYTEPVELKKLADYLIENTGQYLSSPWWASAQALTAKLIFEGSRTEEDLIKAESIAQTASRKFPNAPGGKESAELLGGMNKPDLSLKYDNHAQALVIKSRGVKAYELQRQKILPTSINEATQVFEALAGEELSDLKSSAEPELVKFEAPEFKDQGQTLHSVPLTEIVGLTKVSAVAQAGETAPMMESVLINPRSQIGLSVLQGEGESLLQFFNTPSEFTKVFIQEASGLVSEALVKDSQVKLPCFGGQSLKLLLVSKTKAVAQKLDCPQLSKVAVQDNGALKIELPQWSQKSEGFQAKVTKKNETAQWPERWQVDRLEESTEPLNQFLDLKKIPSQFDPILSGTVNEVEGAERKELLIDLSGLSEGLYRLSLLEPNPQSQVFLIAEDSPGLKLPLLIAQGVRTEKEQSLFLFLGTEIKWAFLDIFQSGKLSQRIRIETSKRLSLEVPEGVDMAYRLWNVQESGELMSTELVPPGSTMSSMIATKPLLVRKSQTQRGLTFEPGRLKAISN